MDASSGVCCGFANFAYLPHWLYIVCCVLLGAAAAELRPDTVLAAIAKTNQPSFK